MRRSANKDIWKPATKKTGYTVAATLVFVACYRSLKFLTDDHSDLLAVYLETDYMLLCNVRCN